MTCSSDGSSGLSSVSCRTGADSCVTEGVCVCVCARVIVGVSVCSAASSQATPGKRAAVPPHRQTDGRSVFALGALGCGPLFSAAACPFCPYLSVRVRASLPPPPSFSPLPVLSSLTDGWKWRHVAADPRSRAACSTWSSAHTAVFCCWSSFVVACARIVRGVSVPGRVGGFILF